jgi:hypothetical protein
MVYRLGIRIQRADSRRLMTEYQVGFVGNRRTKRLARSGVAALFTAWLVASPIVHADGSEPTADEIAARMVRGDAFSWEGARTRVRMQLIEDSSKPGQVRERAMDIVGRRKAGLFQTLVRFLAPQDIAGTAFLMLERNKEASEQYVYLPGLKRTRRIVGREREGSFMGSDFTYADMQRVDARYAKHQKLPDETLGKDAVWVLESTIDEDAPTAYGKVMTWVRKSDYIALRTRFYDRNGKLAKTLYTRRVRELDGKPVVVEARMQSGTTKHATDMYIDTIEKKDDLADTDFTPAALEHL